MAARWCARAVIAVVVAFAGAGAGVLAGGSTGAQASDTSSSSAKSLIGISLPALGVTLPGIGVTVPRVGVTLPGVTVSTPAVTVSTPEVSVSTPSLTGSTSTQPSTTPVEAPTSSATTPTGPSGGGTGTSPTTTPSFPVEHAGDRASAASVSDTAPNASHTTATAVGRTSAGGARGRRHAAAARAVRGHHVPRHGSGAGVGVAAGAVAAPTGVGRPSGAPSASRVAGHSSSNPLDTIGKRIPLPLPVPDWSKPIILLLLVLAIWFGVRARMAARRARRLEHQRTTLLQDVDALQAALVPEIPVRVGGLSVSVAYRPAEGPAAGGDFYDVFVPERGKVAIILGDVAGHGHRALTRAALTRYTLRAYLQAGLEPRAALALAGRVLADPSAEHFATVILGIYCTRDGLLTYASAGHPPPILHGLQMPEPLAGCASPPVGWTAPTGRRQTTVSLAPGAVVCFFSDGLIEARCKEEMLGRERLSELLAALGPRPDATKLLARIRAQTLATPDDMAACILAPEMSVIAARTHIEELEVDARGLGTAHIRRFLESSLVDLADIERVLARASDIAAVFGTALLRVELTDTSVTATATAPPPGSQDAMIAQRPPPIGEPSGAR